jgi:hypothetical protein
LYFLSILPGLTVLALLGVLRVVFRVLVVCVLVALAIHYPFVHMLAHCWMKSAAESVRRP